MKNDTKDSVLRQVTRILDNYLEMNNHRKTPERYKILEAIYATPGHFTLDELSDKLASEYRFPVSRATLYNTFNLFLQLRLVTRHRFQSATVYEACYDNDNHCHQVCTVCGRVTEVSSPLIDEALEATRLHRFRRNGYTLYIYGICSSCAARITRMRNQDKKTRQNKDKSSKA